jgi:hypothetical protein
MAHLGGANDESRLIERSLAGDPALPPVAFAASGWLEWK